jgi:hypothetical protein
MSGTASSRMDHQHGWLWYSQSLGHHGLPSGRDATETLTLVQGAPHGRHPPYAHHHDRLVDLGRRILWRSALYHAYEIGGRQGFCVFGFGACRWVTFLARASVSDLRELGVLQDYVLVFAQMVCREQEIGVVICKSQGVFLDVSDAFFAGLMYFFQAFFASVFTSVGLMKVFLAVLVLHFTLARCSSPSYKTNFPARSSNTSIELR